MKSTITSPLEPQPGITSGRYSNRQWVFYTSSKDHDMSFRGFRVFDRKTWIFVGLAPDGCFYPLSHGYTCPFGKVTDPGITKIEIKKIDNVWNWVVEVED